MAHKSDEDNGGMSRSANILADAVAFAPGSLYSCKKEFYLDQRSSRYKQDLVFANNCDAKMLRTLEKYPSWPENTEAHADAGNSHYGRVDAVRNADGSVSAEAVDIFGSPIGETHTVGKPQTAREVAHANRLPLFENLPGGVTRVSINRETQIPKDDAGDERSIKTSLLPSQKRKK